MTTRTTARRTRKTAAVVELTPWQLGEQHGQLAARCSILGEGEAPAFVRFASPSDQRDYDWSRACSVTRAERELLAAR